MRKLPIALLAGLALAACGGSSGSTDATAVRKAVNRWTQAVVRHDGPAACAQLSRTLRKAIERHLLGEGVEGNCRTWAARWVSPRHPAAHRDAHVVAVRVHAGRATVSLTAHGIPDGEVRLVKEGGTWRINDY